MDEAFRPKQTQRMLDCVGFKLARSALHITASVLLIP